MFVYVVMSRWVPDDDGNENVDIVSVHQTREGAEGNLVDPYAGPGNPTVRYIVETELMP